MKQVEPPAIVRTAKQAAMALVKSIIGKAKEVHRSLGKALNDLRTLCTEHGEWTATLADLGIAKSTAHDSMRRAKRPDEPIFCLHDDDSKDEKPSTDTSIPSGNIGSERRTFEPSQADIDTVVENGTAQNVPSAKPVEPKPEWKHCRNCRISTPRPGCKDCKELNATPKREPGDDTGNINPKTIGPKIGSIVFDVKEFHKSVAHPYQMLLVVARAAGMVDKKGTICETPELEAFRRRSEEFRADAEAWARQVLKTIPKE